MLKEPGGEGGRTEKGVGRRDRGEEKEMAMILEGLPSGRERGWKIGITVDCWGAAARNRPTSQAPVREGVISSLLGSRLPSHSSGPISADSSSGKATGGHGEQRWHQSPLPKHPWSLSHTRPPPT